LNYRQPTRLQTQNHPQYSAFFTHVPANKVILYHQERIIITGLLILGPRQSKI
jgi:hypothetical protein